MGSYYATLFPRVTTNLTTEPKKKGMRARGYDLNRVKNHKVLMNDQQVLEARWMYEFGEWTRQRVATHYGMTFAYIIALLSYQTRSKIMPSKEDFPAGHLPVSSTSSPMGSDSSLPVPDLGQSSNPIDHQPSR